MAIIVITNGKNSVKIRKEPIRKEYDLQKYVYDNPDCLPLDELRDSLRLLVLVREFQTSSGPIDLLAVDREGDLFVVETKLFKNPDKRHVVAQMLDYGAALWRGYPNPDEFLDDVDAALDGKLGARLKGHFALTDEEAKAICEQMKRNLISGSIRFVVLMDQLDDGLRNLILFINQKSKFDIYAVEIEFYRHGELEIAIPKLHGQEVKKDAGVAKPRDVKYIWDESRFLNVAREHLVSEPRLVDEFGKLLNFSSSVADAVNFVNSDFKANNCTAHFVFRKIGKKAPYSLATDGQLQLNLKWIDDGELRRRFEEEVRSAGISDLNKGRWERGVSIDAIDWREKVPQFEQIIRRLFLA